MKQRKCEKCAQVKADAIKQLGLISDWQARVFDLEQLAREVRAMMIDMKERDELSADDLALLARIEAAIGAADRGNASAAALADIIQGKEPQHA